MPWVSSLLAMFTVSPQMSKANLRWPITPPMTGPEWTPTRSRRSASAIAFLRGSVDHGEPEVDRAGGVVSERLRESTGRHVGIADRLDLLEAELGDKLIEAPEQAIEHPDDFVDRHSAGSGVNPTMSAKRTVTAGYVSAIVRSPARRREEIDPGRTFCSSASARSFST